MRRVGYVQSLKREGEMAGGWEPFLFGEGFCMLGFTVLTKELPVSYPTFVGSISIQSLLVDESCKAAKSNLYREKVGF